MGKESARPPALEDVVRALRPATSLLARASRGVRLLGAATPVNLREERDRLARCLARAAPLRPRWRYAPHDLGALPRELGRLAEGLGGDRHPLVALLRGRAEELHLECELVLAVGTRRFDALARARFEVPPGDAGLARAREGLGAEVAPPEPGSLASDDPSPASLLSRLRAELAARRLPFGVRAVDGLSALAATGDAEVLVARGRATTPRDVVRTVLHEVEGHVLPRVRARGAALPIFRLGTRRGVDEQEGYAVWLEERAGYLDPGRLRELSARRVAVDLAFGGADYGDVARALALDHGFPCEEAVRIAERAFRGGDGAHLGLARDACYLGAWLRLREALEADPSLVEVVGGGQVSLEAARALAALGPAARATLGA